MKSAVPIVRSLLLADTTLLSEALLNGPHIYGMEPPQTGPASYLRLYDVDGSPVGEHLGGTTVSWRRRVSIDCQGDSYARADAIGSRVVAVLANYTGVVLGVRVDALRVAGDVFLYDEQSRKSRRVVDFQVHMSTP